MAAASRCDVASMTRVAVAVSRAPSGATSDTAVRTMVMPTKVEAGRGVQRLTMAASTAPSTTAGTTVRAKPPTKTGLGERSTTLRAFIGTPTARAASPNSSVVTAPASPARMAAPVIDRPFSPFGSL